MKRNAKKGLREKKPELPKGQGAVNEHYLLARCVVDFMRCFEEARSMADQLAVVVDSVRESNSERKMKQVLGELLQCVDDFEPRDLVAFETFAAARGLTYSGRVRRQQVEKLLGKRSLKSDNEYYQVKEFVEREHMNPMESDQVTRGIRLIEAFEVTKKTQATRPRRDKSE